MGTIHIPRNLLGVGPYLGLVQYEDTILFLQIPLLINNSYTTRLSCLNTGTCICYDLSLSTCRTASRWDCGTIYQLSVKLLAVDKKTVIDKCHIERREEQWAGKAWNKVLYHMCRVASAQ